MTSWGSPVEVERRNRIRLSIAAYAYEIESCEIIPDREFDRIAQQLERNMSTDHPVMDKFFREEFSAMTGMWIHRHPELEKIKSLYIRHWKGKR